MFSLRTHVIISAALLALLIGIPLVGSMFVPRALRRRPKR
jgi:hypothetical protein